MDLGIRGKKALVTGASKGIGRAAARMLAQEGVSVCCVARSAELLQTLLPEINENGLGHCVYACDLMQADGSARLQEYVRASFGVPDIIIHSMGGTRGIRDLASIGDGYAEVWKFNLGVAIDLNNSFLPDMARQHWGRIVHISSSAAVNVDASLPYSSAKAALNAYAKGLGRAVAKDGIVVSCVMPGPVLFEGNKWDIMRRDDPSGFDAFLRQHMPSGRCGGPDEIAAAVVFLCSQQASFCPGVIMPVDGGMC